MTTLYKLLEQLKSHNWIDLTHPVHIDIPRFSAFNPIIVESIATIDTDGFLGQQVTIGTQYGTHIDAPNHFAKGRRELTELTLKERTLPLYVIHKVAAAEENPDYELTIQDIKAFEAEHGQIQPDSFVAFATGWSDRFDSPEAFYNRDEDGVEHTPGWSVEALQFLHEERNVTAIGHETLNTDSGTAIAKHQALPAELYWLEQDKYQVEVIKGLADLPATGALIHIAAPRIEGLGGFNTEIFAILPN